MAAEVAREDHDSVHDTSSLLGRSATANVDSAPLRPSDVIPQAAVVVKTTSVVAPPAATLLPASTQAAQPRPSDSASAVMGLILVIAASATFASMSLLVSLAARLGVPSLLSATFRFGAQAAFSVAWIARAKRGRLGVPETWLGKPANRRLLVQRGLIGAVSMCCLFYTVSTIPLAEATCIAFLNVPITAAVAACFLGERYTVVDGLAGAASAVGVVLVVQPSALFGGGASLPVLSLASGLLYSILSALVFVTIRAIGPGESALVLVLYFGVTGCVVAPVLLAALQASPSSCCLRVCMPVAASRLACRPSAGADAWGARVPRYSARTRGGRRRARVRRPGAREPGHAAGTRGPLVGASAVGSCSSCFPPAAAAAAAPPAVLSSAGHAVQRASLCAGLPGRRAGRARGRPDAARGASDHERHRSGSVEGVGRAKSRGEAVAGCCGGYSYGNHTG